MTPELERIVRLQLELDRIWSVGPPSLRRMTDEERRRRRKMANEARRKFFPES